MECDWLYKTTCIFVHASSIHAFDGMPMWDAVLCERVYLLTTSHHFPLLAVQLKDRGEGTSGGRRSGAGGGEGFGGGVKGAGPSPQIGVFMSHLVSRHMLQTWTQSGAENGDLKTILH